MTRTSRRARAIAVLLAAAACGDPPQRAFEAHGSAELRHDSTGSSPADARSLTVRLLDVTDSRVGGQAVLISDSSSGEAKHVLVDGGEQAGTVLGALRRFGVRGLALVVLTHAHADHYGGLASVVRALPVAAFAYNGDARALRTYRRLLAAVDSAGVRPIVVARAVRTVTLVTAGDTLVIRLLPPPPPDRRMPGDPINNRSVGVLVRYGRFSALIPGDAEHAEQRSWVRRFDGELDADLLVASHHGSRDANSTVRSRHWYKTVTPRLLLISANGRQHPYLEVLDYARAQGVPIYCTADHGSIAVRAFRAGRWTVRTDRAGACTPGIERPLQPPVQPTVSSVRR
jgi:competence protein ComEC